MDTHNEDSRQSSTRRRAYAIAKELTFTDEERWQFAEFFLKVDVSSWRNLTEAQIERVADALEGARLVKVILQQRP